MADAKLSFTHRFLPATDPSCPITLLALHGTGGDDADMAHVAHSLFPPAAVISPLGQVSEHGMPRFFRRFGEGMLDLEDLKRRAADLAAFVRAASGRYGFDPKGVVALGYSNGANIGVGLLLEHPEVLAGAALLRPMISLEPDEPPDLHGRSILIESGTADPIVPNDHPPRLAELFRAGGATVELRQHPMGHGLTQIDVTETRQWLADLTAQRWK